MFDRIGRRLTAPIANRAAECIPQSVSPQTITGFGLLAGMACALAGSQGWIVGSLLLWTINRLADGLDGALSRFRSDNAPLEWSAQDRGGYFDLMADFVSYASVPIGIAWQVDDRRTWISLAVLLAAFYVNLGAWTLLSAIQEKRGFGAASAGESTSITMPATLIEGTETIVAYFAFLLFPSAAHILFGVFAALVALSAAQRIIWANRNL